MTEAEALDLALPILRRADLDPVALRVLSNRRLALSEILFAHCGIDAAGNARYLIGDPADPVPYTSKRANAENLLALHTLVATGTLKAAEWSDAADPVEAVRKRLARVLDDLYAVHKGLVAAIGPLDSVDGHFRHHHRPGQPRIVTARPKNGGNAAVRGEEKPEPSIVASST